MWKYVGMCGLEGDVHALSFLLGSLDEKRWFTVSLEELLSTTSFAQVGSWISSLLTADPVLESFLSKVGGNDTREKEQEKKGASVLSLGYISY